ncbi:MAG: O-antigen ligase family protein [Candidatus Kerfeldbacteria bacterium]
MTVQLVITVAAVFTALLAFWRPRLALAAVILALPAYLIKTSVAGIPVTVLEGMLIGACIGWFVQRLIAYGCHQQSFKEDVGWVRSALPRNVLMAVAVGIAGWLIATTVSIDIRASLGALKAWLIEPMLFGLMVLIESRDDKTVNVVLRSLMALMFWVSLAGLIQEAWFRGTMQDARLSSVFAPVANYYAMLAAPLFVLALGLIIANRERTVAIVSSVVSAAALLLSFSYGGFFAVCAGGIVLIWTQLSQTIRRRAFFILGGMVVVTFIALLPSRHFQEKLNFTTRSSSLVRTEIWRTAVEIGIKHPIVGIGPNTFEKEYRIVAPTLYHPPLEWLVAKPHNLYLNAWIETGALGLIGLLWVSVAVFVRLFRSRGTRSAISPVVGASCVAILVHGFVDTTLFKNDLTVLAVVLVVIGLAMSFRDVKSNA